MVADAQDTRKKGPPLWLGITLLVAGILVAAPPVVIMGVRGARTLTTASTNTPATIQRHLGTGTWMVFERTGTTTGSGGVTFTHNNIPDLTPEQVTVTDPAGVRVPTRVVTVNETITKGSRIYTAAVQFHADSAGRYQVQIITPDARQVLIARSLGETFRGFIPLAVIASGGGLLFLAGAVLLIVGAVRRSRAATTG